MLMNNYQKINRFLILGLTTVTLTSGNFVAPVMSVALDAEEIFKVIIDGGPMFISCVKGTSIGWDTRQVSFPSGWGFTPQDLAEQVCQTAAAGARGATNFFVNLCPNCLKEYQQDKEYKVAQCPSCRRISARRVQSR